MQTVNRGDIKVASDEPTSGKLDCHRKNKI